SSARCRCSSRSSRDPETANLGISVMTPTGCKSTRSPSRTAPGDRRHRALMASAATVAALCLGDGAVRAGDYAALETPSPNDKTANEAFLKTLQAMEQRINTLESELKRKGNGSGTAKSVQATASNTATNLSAADTPSDAPKNRTGQQP